VEAQLGAEREKISRGCRTRVSGMMTGTPPMTTIASAAASGRESWYGAARSSPIASTHHGHVDSPNEAPGGDAERRSRNDERKDPTQARERNAR